MAINYDKLAEQLESLLSNPPDDLIKDEATRHRLAAAAQSLVPVIETPKDTIQRLNYLPLELAMARVGSTMGLFEKLVTAHGPLSTTEISKQVDGDPTTLDRIFRYLANLSMIKEVDSSSWSTTELTKTLAQPLVAAGLLHNFDTIVPGLVALPGYLEDKRYRGTGDINDTAFSRAHNNVGAFQWVNENPINMQAMGMWMSIQRYAQESWLDGFPFNSEVLSGLTDDARIAFVDVGGGIGHQCQSLLKQFPTLKDRVVLEDQPQALVDALDVPGMEKQPLDFFQGQPVKGAKSYYLRNILHDWSDKQCLEILAHIKDAMATDSILLVDEMVVPSKGAHKIATQIDLTMFVNVQGEERSEARWYELLGRAGFEITKIYTYQKEIGDSVIVARKT